MICYISIMTNNVFGATMNKMFLQNGLIFDENEIDNNNITNRRLFRLLMLEYQYKKDTWLCI